MGGDVVLREACVHGLHYECQTFAFAPYSEDRIQAVYETVSSGIENESEETDPETESDQDEESKRSIETYETQYSI